MTHDQSPMLYPLPAEPDPAGYKCYTVKVPDDVNHINAFFGALETLGYWANWQRDADRKARIAAYRWRTIINSLKQGDCDVSQVQFRQPNDCTLEASFDSGATWQVIYSGYACASGAITDALNSGTIPNPVQPSAGGTIPVDQCWHYHVVLRGNDKWHAPVPVSAGYNITVTNARGGWSDGVAGGVTWQCPDGHIYALGICQSLTVPAQTGDPIQTINHMALIGHVSEYFSAIGNTYVVPNGVSNSDLTFQANDGTISDNLGSIEFDVEICNYGTWRQDFYFNTGAHGWFAYNSWSNLQADGWHGVFVQGQNAVYNYIALNIPEGCNITGVDVILTNRKVLGSLGSLVRGKDGLNWTGNITFNYNDPTGDGIDRQHYETGASLVGNGTKYLLAAMVSYTNFDNVFEMIRIYGTGVKPTFS